MTHDDNGMYSSVASRRTRRHRQVTAGVAGLLAVLGGVAGYRLIDDGEPATTDAGAVVPMVPTVATSTAAVTPSRSASGRTSAPATTSTAAPAPSPDRTRTDAERKKAVQGLAASQAAHLVKQPLPPVGGAAAVDDVTVTTTGKPGNSLKVVSAPHDLTGYRELGWAAGKGEPVGDARCTSTIRLSNTQPRERPTLLLCWRTSATKSVYTVAVRSGGRPSKAESVAALDKQWVKLG